MYARLFVCMYLPGCFFKMYVNICMVVCMPVCACKTLLSCFLFLAAAAAAAPTVAKSARVGGEPAKKSKKPVEVPVAAHEVDEEADVTELKQVRHLFWLLPPGT